MSGGASHIALLVAALSLGGATVKPGGIAAAQPGLWDISQSATGTNATRLCLADPAVLAQWEHRAASCTRTQISEKANMVTFEYRCVGGGFGRSDVTLLTPRSLRLETQGISGGLPFGYKLYARRVGMCPHR